uniref:PPM-type phosphatase domain-containing protein n=1 Tax=Haptolina brevifila TaxID=156173 RepID=A0A6U7GBJ2_9EUKA
MSSPSDFRKKRLSVTAATAMTQGDDGSRKSPMPQSPGRSRRLSISPELGAKSTDVPFDQTKVYGTFSCHGVEPGTREGQKVAKINQDRGAVVYPLDVDYKRIECTEALFCVYDGHGEFGDKVSQFVVTKLPEMLALEVDLLDTTSPDKVGEALKRAFVATDEALKADSSVDDEISGTTAVVVLVREYSSSVGELHLWTAWAGDSRAVLWTVSGDSAECLKSDVIDLSHDHKPDTPKEHNRIKKSGGFVSPQEEAWGGPARVWLDAGQEQPGLAMARSIGDRMVKSVGVIPEAELSYKRLDMSSGKQRYLVLASDGVWEFVCSHEAFTVISMFLGQGTTHATTKLIETSAARWRKEEGDYRDDITAICVSLHALREDPNWKVRGSSYTNGTNAAVELADRKKANNGTDENELANLGKLMQKRMCCGPAPRGDDDNACTVQ